MATIKQRGNRWQARVKRAGHTASRTFTTKADATAWARQQEAAIERGIAVGPRASSDTLASIIDRYLVEVTPTKRSAANEAQRLRALRERLGHHRIDRLQPHMLVTYAGERLQAVKPQTVKHDINTLCVVIDHGIHVWGLVLPAGNPAELARRTITRRKMLAGITARERRPAGEELACIIACLPAPIDAMACMAIETCMRRSELVAMRWEHIDLERGTIDVPAAKSGARRIALSAGARDLVEALGPRERGMVWEVTPDQVTQAWRRACERSAVASLTFHDLRHEGVSRLFEGRTFGRPLAIPEAQLQSGHKTWSQLQRYTQLQPEALHQ